MGMREYWVQLQASPIVYRYVDWSLTVPLQMIEFFLILQAVKPDLGSGMFFRLLIGTVLMLLFGYMGEAMIINAWAGFAVGMCGWGFILFEVFAGEASTVAKDNLSPAVENAYNLMRFIVSIGWSIYPLGYFFGYLLGQVSDAPLNLIYNLADFVNKIWFCLAIWNAARTETLAGKKSSAPGVSSEVNSLNIFHCHLSSTVVLKTAVDGQIFCCSVGPVQSSKFV